MEELPQYYYENIDRTIAEGKLINQQDGSYLLRRKTGEAGTYVISLKTRNGVSHHLVKRCLQTGSFYTDEGVNKFSSLHQLCQFYKSNKGFESKLLYPVCAKEYEEIENILQYPWFHGSLEKGEDHSRLTKAYFTGSGPNDGIFLVRNRSGNSCEYVLCLAFNKEVFRYVIKNTDGLYQLDGNRRLPGSKTLKDLLAYLKETPCEMTGLQFRPIIPCPKPRSSSCTANSPVPAKYKKVAKELEFMFDAFNTMNVVEDQAMTSSTHQLSVFDIVNAKTELVTNFDRQSKAEECPGYFSPYQNLNKPGVSLAPDLYISEEKVKIYKDVLGKGHFGTVKPALCVINCVKVKCAVKHLSGPVINENRSKLINEAEIMQRLDHPSIVRLLALIKNDSNDEIRMVLELAHLGPLDKFIKKRKKETYPENKCLTIMKQVCEAMVYLSNHNVLHRDLAARNILLVSENFAKISDFGLSRILAENEDYYRATSADAWPIRWYAPETTSHYKFSSKSDVWSYGITLWEVFSYGKRPYGRMTAADILQMVHSDTKLECPTGCSPGVYAIMLQCWTYTTSDRPSFEDVLLQIEKYEEKFSSSC